MSPLIDILSHPLWQSVGAIISVIALGASIIFFVVERRQQKKELTFSILSNTSLFQSSPQIRDKLKVLYNYKIVLPYPLFRALILFYRFR